MTREPEYVNTRQTPEAQEAHDLLRQNVATLTQQRDELAEALRELAKSAEDYGASPAGGNEMMSRFEDAISSAHAALAKVKP